MQIIDNAASVGWATYPWPAWVPDSVRVHVEHLWPNPLAWANACRCAAAPRLGAAVHLTLPDGRVVAGNYVHLRGLVGRVITREPVPAIHPVTLDRGQPRLLIRP